MRDALHAILLLCAMLCLSSCHPSDSGSSTSTTPQREVNLSGSVIDGYIADANVCVEHKGEAICTTSDLNGSYRFDPLFFDEDALISIVAQGGIDTATQAPYDGTITELVDLKSHPDTISLQRNITPLSDLYSLGVLESNTSLEQSKIALAKAYGVALDLVDADPMQENSVFVASQDIQQSKALLGVMATKLSTSSLEQSEIDALRQDIRKALAKNANQMSAVDLAAVIELLEQNWQKSVKDTDKEYVIAQRGVLRNALDAFALTPDLDGDKRAEYQDSLSQKMDQALEMFENFSGDGVLEPLAMQEQNQTIPTPQEPSYAVSGVMVDGYISDATVCIDRDADGVCGINEPRTTTQKDGSFSFAAQGLQAQQYYKVIAYGGTDTAVQKEFDREYTGVLSTFGENDSLMLTPLNDLVTRMFFRSQTLDTQALEDARKSVSAKLSLQTTQLNVDPFTLKGAMLTSLGVESIYAVMQSVLKEQLGVSNLSLEQKNEIREAMLEEFLESGYSGFVVSQALIRLEIKLSMIFAAALRDFAIDQINETLSKLQDLNNAGDIEANSFERIQKLLSEDLEQALSSQSYQTLNLNSTTVLYSAFDKNGALYDENACIQNEIYTHKHTQSSAQERYTDLNNGIIMGFDDAKVEGLQSFTLYYPSLSEGTKTDEQVHFEGDYYFSYDEAWIQTGMSVYLQAPSDTSGILKCYKIKLDQLYGSYLLFEPVYRYTQEP